MEDARPYHSIYISETAFSTIKGLLSRKWRAEARGELLGYATPSNELVITHVTLSATKTTHPTDENTDEENPQEETNVLSERYEGKINRVGEWCRFTPARSNDAPDDADAADNGAEENLLPEQGVLLLCSRATGLFRRNKHKFRALAPGNGTVKDRSLQVISDSDPLITAITLQSGNGQKNLPAKCEPATP